jgi:hypothetical protein
MKIENSLIEEAHYEAWIHYYSDDKGQKIRAIINEIDGNRTFQSKMKKEKIYLSLALLSLLMGAFCSVSMWFTESNELLVPYIVGFTMWCMIGTLSMSSYLHYKTK